jgi:3-hydroxy-3-methylglutaryl CoA synthase
MTGAARKENGFDSAAVLPGILAMEVYFPSCYVKQSALEEHMAVGAGKYTVGLGQEGLAITGDSEDINSICLTVVANLLEKCVCSSAVTLSLLSLFLIFS